MLEPDPFRRAVASGLGLEIARSRSPTTSAGGRRDVDRRRRRRRRLRGVRHRQAGVAPASRCSRVRGRLVVVGIHAEPRPVDLFRVFWRELTVVGARVYERADFERAVELLADAAHPRATARSRTSCRSPTAAPRSRRSGPAAA